MRTLRSALERPTPAIGAFYPRPSLPCSDYVYVEWVFYGRLMLAVWFLKDVCHKVNIARVRPLVWWLFSFHSRTDSTVQGHETRAWRAMSKNSCRGRWLRCPYLVNRVGIRFVIKGGRTGRWFFVTGWGGCVPFSTMSGAEYSHCGHTCSIYVLGRFKPNGPCTMLYGVHNGG